MRDCEKNSRGSPGNIYIYIHFFIYVYIYINLYLQGRSLNAGFPFSMFYQQHICWMHLESLWCRLKSQVSFGPLFKETHGKRHFVLEGFLGHRRPFWIDWKGSRTFIKQKKVVFLFLQQMCIKGLKWAYIILNEGKWAQMDTNVRKWAWMDTYVHKWA